MSFTFRKRIKITPGVNVNVSKKGIRSITVGKRGLSTNLNSKGVKGTVGAHGTGVSYTTKTLNYDKIVTQKHKKSFSIVRVILGVIVSVVLIVILQLI